jgi:AraC-like DNA-binding protein
MLLTAPPSWVLRAGDGDPTLVDLEDARTNFATPEHWERGDDSVQVCFVGGHFEFDSVNTELLMTYLSPIMHIRSSGSGNGERLDSVFAMIDAEVATTRPGQDAVLSRLLEIVLIELLRAPEMLSNQQRGMLTGLTDPQIGSALRAFHANIGKGWSVASLATEAKMSRSVFSDRFTSLVGQPPMTYALHWRMAVARDALRFSNRSVDEIARATSYRSASAFSTAFTRTVGRSPGRFARDAAALQPIHDVTHGRWSTRSCGNCGQDQNLRKSGCPSCHHTSTTLPTMLEPLIGPQ